MSKEIIVEYGGVKYSAQYEVIDDTLEVYLPDGSSRSTELKGLNPRSSAKVHLYSYIKSKTE